MVQVKTSRLTLEVERHGDPAGVPLLLIRGLGTQLIHWPPRLITALVGQGFHVIAFDNRDVGLSEKFGQLGVPLDGEPAPYSLADMADDSASLILALGFERLHVLGASMGGMVAQHLSVRHSALVQSVTIVMSSSGAPELPRWSEAVDAAMRPVPGTRQTKETAVAGALEADRLWCSPGYPFDPERRAALHAAAYDRCYNPDGVARHFAAMERDGSRTALLREIARPCLIIHGTDDAIFPVEHGRDLAARVPRAELLEFPGMGHDLEGDLAELTAAAVGRLMRRVSRD